MVVCSVTVDFDDVRENLDDLFSDLKDDGDFSISSSAIYFASDLPKISGDWVKKILKKDGIKEFIFHEFDPKHLPKEDDSFEYGWVLDKVLHNSSLAFVRENKKQLQTQSDQLDRFMATLSKMQKSLEKEAIDSKGKSPEENKGVAPLNAEVKANGVKQ